MKEVGSEPTDLSSEVEGETVTAVEGTYKRERDDSE